MVMKKQDKHEYKFMPPSHCWQAVQYHLTLQAVSSSVRVDMYTKSLSRTSRKQQGMVRHASSVGS